MRKKIYCIEKEKKGFDKVPMKELYKMVGWIEPIVLKDDYGNIRGEHWTVTMLDESFFDCETQHEAQSLANQEMIQAMLMKLLR
jgi:hypothetical protein